MERPDTTRKRARDEAVARLEERLAQMEHRLADVNLTVCRILQILLSSPDGGQTPAPAMLPRAPQPPDHSAITLQGIVQFWNEAVDWQDPDASLTTYRSQIQRDGWSISETVMRLYRVVYQGDCPSQLFLFPYLKKAKKYYQSDFFVGIGSGDSKELVRPAEVQPRKPGANVDHEIQELLGGSTPLSEVFQVVQKGEIL
jgi:hypothetical protein